MGFKENLMSFRECWRLSRVFDGLSEVFDRHLNFLTAFQEYLMGYCIFERRPKTKFYPLQGISMVLGTEDHQEKLLEVSQKASSDFYLLPQILTFDPNERLKTNGASYEQMLDQITNLSGIESKSLYPLHEFVLICFTHGLMEDE